MRVGYRVMTVGALAAVAVAGLAGPALAHVEVSADKTTAGAENVTLTFNGEAENDAAGIQSERVVLPDGIDPATVTLVKGPAGWTFTRTADGFTVAGKALKVGADAEWKVKIAKLPAGETRLSFKTLETYGNGDVSRWIEIQEAGQDEPENPAPLVTLKPGPSTAATTPSAPSTLPVVSPSAVVAPSDSTGAAPVVTPAAAVADDDGGTLWWLWVVVAALAVVGLVLWQVRRRTAAGTED
ncbi:DUF1775 domain-containing protein [Micromonosporaceae bacterium Da 78-11]